MGPHGHHDIDGATVLALPVVGSLWLLTLLLLALAGWYLWRRGMLRLPDRRSATSPEDGAKQILADRFARGDISAEEFMERASYLNWTPGTRPEPVRPGLGRGGRRS
jgi:putative membrane protein